MALLKTHAFLTKEIALKIMRRITAACMHNLLQITFEAAITYKFIQLIPLFFKDIILNFWLIYFKNECKMRKLNVIRFWKQINSLCVLLLIFNLLNVTNVRVFRNLRWCSVLYILISVFVSMFKSLFLQQMSICRLLFSTYCV